jgi:dCTP deaminase
MILSNEGIRTALGKGDIEITPVPTEDQYTTSAVDLFLGGDFRQWDSNKFDAPGIVVNLDLAVHTFQKTANAYLVKVPVNPDSSIIFPPYSKTKSHLLGITQERIHLRSSSLLAARVEGRSSLARVGLDSSPHRSHYSRRLQWTHHLGDD